MFQVILLVIVILIIVCIILMCVTRRNRIRNSPIRLENSTNIESTTAVSALNGSSDVCDVLTANIVDAYNNGRIRQVCALQRVHSQQQCQNVLPIPIVICPAIGSECDPVACPIPQAGETCTQACRRTYSGASANCCDQQCCQASPA
jgi:hypothetical protein